MGSICRKSWMGRCGFMNIKILIAIHKKCWLPKDPIYFPLHVGAEGKAPLGYTTDNTGDHISGKNPNYCELTGIYWAWKNLDADVIGLCHYRRYFSHCDSQHKDPETAKRQIWKSADYEKALRECDIILPQRLHFENSETVEAQYAKCHQQKDLHTVRDIISTLHPDYLAAFDTVMKENSLHCFNMFVMKKDLFDRYCEWLFSILFAVEKQVNITEYDSYQARIFGFLSERLLDVWLLQQDVRIKETPVSFLRDKVSVGRQIQAFGNRIRFGISDLLAK